MCFRLVTIRATKLTQRDRPLIDVVSRLYGCLRNARAGAQRAFLMLMLHIGPSLISHDMSSPPPFNSVGLRD